MKNIFKILGVRSIAFFLPVITLAGCSSLPSLSSLPFFGDDEEEVSSESSQSNVPNPLPKNMSAVINDKKMKYEDHLVEWQQAKLDVNKVASLESQVTMLTAKVETLENTQAKLTMQLKTVNRSRAQLTNDSNSTQSSVNEMQGYAIQLFSVPQKSQVQLSWNKAMRKHPSELSGLKRIYEEVTISNRRYYRVKAGVFNSKLKAEQVCSKIISSGSACLATSFKGQSF